MVQQTSTANARAGRAKRYARRLSIAGATTVLVLGFTVSAAMALPFTEVGDAPSLPPGQPTVGTGPLTSISGALSAGDREDLYQICITGPNFSATTVGGANFDTQLFLFRDDGTPVAQGHTANDDASGGLQSTLPASGTYTNTGQPIVYQPGRYFLAISGFNNDPRDSGGNLIFPSSPFTGVFQPNPGVGGLATWTGGGAFGPYTITLTGATFSSSCGRPPIEQDQTNNQTNVGAQNATCTVNDPLPCTQNQTASQGNLHQQTQGCASGTTSCEQTQTSDQSNIVFFQREASGGTSTVDQNQTQSQVDVVTQTQTCDAEGCTQDQTLDQDNNAEANPNLFLGQFEVQG